MRRKSEEGRGGKRGEKGDGMGGEEEMRRGERGDEMEERRVGMERREGGS